MTPGHFIPLCGDQLVESLLRTLPPPAPERALFHEFHRLLSATIHYAYHEQLQELKRLYAPLDPDRDPRLGGRDAPGHEPTNRFVASLSHLLAKANYSRLETHQLEQALQGASRWGLDLHLDLSLFSHLHMYYRNQRLDHRTVCDQSTLFRTRVIETPIYDRLLLAFRGVRASGQDEAFRADVVYLKLFKDVPTLDVDMLLPCTTVKMTRWDQGRILVPTLSGIAMTVFKLVKLAIVGFYSLIAFVGLAAAAIGYGVKSFFGYLRTKDKYQLTLTRNLYYQNLDNNTGVLFRLLDTAEDQEFCEAMLAYYLLWREAPPEGWTETEIDQQAERYLEQVSGLSVDFEVHDALDKLVAWNIVQQGPGGCYRALPLAGAIGVLDQAWDNYFHRPAGSAIAHTSPKREF